MFKRSWWCKLCLGLVIEDTLFKDIVNSAIFDISSLHKANLLSPSFKR